jgi:hypothetical protein
VTTNARWAKWATPRMSHARLCSAYLPGVIGGRSVLDFDLRQF